MLLLGRWIAECKEQVANTGEDVAIARFSTHTSTHTSNTDCNKIVELAKLKIAQGTSLNSWNPFQVLWRLHRNVADLSEADRNLQLMQCCIEKLLIQILQADPRVLTKQELEQLNFIEKLAQEHNVNETVGGKTGH